MLLLSARWESMSWRYVASFLSNCRVLRQKKTILNYCLVQATTKKTQKVLKALKMWMKTKNKIMSLQPSSWRYSSQLIMTISILKFTLSLSGMVSFWTWRWWVFMMCLTTALKSSIKTLKDLTPRSSSISAISTSTHQSKKVTTHPLLTLELHLPFSLSWSLFMESNKMALASCLAVKLLVRNREEEKIKSLSLRCLSQSGLLRMFLLDQVLSHLACQPKRSQLHPKKKSKRKAHLNSSSKSWSMAKPRSTKTGNTWLIKLTWQLKLKIWSEMNSKRCLKSLHIVKTKNEENENERVLKDRKITVWKIIKN